MTFPQKVKAVAEKLGLSAKAKDNKMTSAEWKQFQDAYKQEHGVDLSADQAEYEALQAQAQDAQAISALLNEAEATSEDNGEGEGTEDDDDDDAQQSSESTAPSAEAAPKKEGLTSKVKNLVQKNKTQAKQIEKMSQRASGDQPLNVVNLTISPNGPGSTETHLFGIQHSMFSMEHRWNKLVQNRELANRKPSQKEESTFQAMAKEFGASLAERYELLQKEGRLNPAVLNENFTFTTSDLSDAGLGDQYMTRRQDALIARILMLSSVTPLYPTRYNVQDRELITNAFFSELTQAFQTGQIFKGGMSLQPEYGHVDDVMIKVLFGSMKDIERMYIGYLNTNGSDPIKWTMIEFALLGMYKQAANEYNKRKVMGIAVKPEAGKAGHYLFGSTGIIYTLVRYIHEHKLLPHSDDSFAAYDSASMLTDVKAFIAAVLASVTAKDANLDGYSLNLNANHKSWWLANIRTTYGTQNDFTGPDGYANKVPDTEIPIRWIPNMGSLTMMWLEQPGNIQFLENIPGEMYAMKMKEDMEEVKAWANWKEGTAAAYVGKKFDTLAALTANAYDLQQLFCNKPVVALAANATTLDATAGFWFKSIANETAAPAITDITGAVKGVAYILECGSATFATKIAKSGKFANLTAAYTPTAAGDYIMVVLNSDGDGFLELERCVGGTRTINTATQPNIPGAR